MIQRKRARRAAPRTDAKTTAAAVGAETWLLLVHQLPARAVGLRVKVWRRLQQLGAVAVKGSVYALPDRAEAREDFEWVRAEIVAAAGQATVFQAATIDAVSGDDLRETFRRERQKDYRALQQAVSRSARAVGGRRGDPRQAAKALRAWRDRLAAIEAIDYFNAPGRDDARRALASLERASAPEVAAASGAARPRLDPAAFQQRRWLTRPRPGIDRMASAWLIRRFIDPRAVFAFAEPEAPRRTGTVAFDTFEGDFTHEGERCTFEVLCARFALSDPRLDDIAQLVHDLDLKDGRFARAEAPLLGALVEGLRGRHASDAELLEQGIALFETLYQGRMSSTAPGGARAGRARRR